jgi:hypothetical protein
MKFFFKSTDRKAKEALSSKEIYDLALDRLATAFKITKKELRPEMVFGKDLKSQKSVLFLFAEDKLMAVFEDVNFVTTAVFRREKDFFGDVDIEKIYARTVGEYCKHMVRCYQIAPDIVESVLKPEVER